MGFNISEGETIYEAVASNRNENNISIRGGFLLYSRCRCPIIYNLATKRVEGSLQGHQDEINAQHFVATLNEDQSSYLDIISTSHDKSAIIWRVNTQDTRDFKILHQFSSPDDNVFLTSSCILKEDNNYYSITTTIDGNIYCWKNAELLQTEQVEYCCFASHLYTISVDKQTTLTFLFLSGSDNKIHVFQLLSSAEEYNNQIIDYLFNLSGYNDWVKCIDTIKLAGRQNEFLLATASQDSLVRVWHMKLVIDQEIDPTRTRTITSKTLKLQTYNTTRLLATLETVLSGHEGFVHGLCWFKRQNDPTSLQLFSCSADKTIVLWRSTVAQPSVQDQGGLSSKYEQCPASKGIWKEIQRLGETGETNLPFLGICLDDVNDDKTLYAQSLRGAIHSWKLKNCDQKEDGSELWVASESITGHYDSITDLSWEKSGSYILSSSLDKTCRLHSLSAIDNKWHELTRPQVHGHEINCVTSLDFCNFASGAEEKTIRTFGATQFFLKNYKSLAYNSDKSTDLDILINAKLFDLDQLPVHAQLPALGLSNRGASSPYDVGGNAEDIGDAATSGLPASGDGSWNEISNLVKQLAKIDHLTALPYEEILLQSTLWWETNKIFGHCNELHALACDSSGRYLASASKANRVDLAKIFVWETEKFTRFRKVGTIEHHSLTITRLKFSPNDKYLLSVSRDRTWSLSEKTGQMRIAYRFLLGTNKSNAIHERIIWDCCWTHDSQYFLTVSRDKRAILWDLDCINRTIGSQERDAGSTAINHVTMKLFECPIQAVDSLPSGYEFATIDSGYLFALGLESGTLELDLVCRDSSNQFQWTRLRLFANFHQLPIRRLAFRPSSRSRDREHGEFSRNNISVWLASGSDDCILKLTKFDVSK